MGAHKSDKGSCSCPSTHLYQKTSFRVFRVYHLHSLKLIWPLKICTPKRKRVFQPSIFMVYLSSSSPVVLRNTIHNSILCWPQKKSSLLHRPNVDPKKNLWGSTSEKEISITLLGTTPPPRLWSFARHLVQGGPLPVLNGVKTPGSRVITRVNHLFLAIYRSYVD